MVGGSLETASNALRTWRQRSESLQAVFSVQGPQQGGPLSSSPHYVITSKPLVTVAPSNISLVSPTLRSTQAPCSPREEADAKPTPMKTCLRPDAIPQMSTTTNNEGVRRNEAGTFNGNCDSQISACKRWDLLERSASADTSALPHCGSWCYSPISNQTSRRRLFLCDSFHRKDWRLQHCACPSYASLPHTNQACFVWSRPSCEPKGKRLQSPMYGAQDSCAKPTTLNHRAHHTAYSVASVGRTVCHNKSTSRRKPTTFPLGTFPSERSRRRYPAETWKRISRESEV